MPGIPAAFLFFLQEVDTMDPKRQKLYCDVLARELVPAMGCTELIAVAYAAASARNVLGCVPDRGIPAF